ncbi:hypothetical protein NRIC_11390 [Enterococcus florum]|uniref:DUF3784 domain-containing protein n=1 Tax=Enterococcus florum TaxID=2480627 RepID=A0A4P5PBD3_9ENTE|nr:hypothetical protein [Enterococcus florum]GCF93248.1 hypothetical protein NRIC_11390 [Enterococcus florum]
MIQILMIVMAVLLFLCSYYLLQRSESLFVLIAKTKDNQRFLRYFGLLYAAFGVIGLFIAIIDHSTPSMIYLIIVILFSAVFSIQLAKKAKSSL